MVREAQRTGAQMLYSDEDKIDQAGYFLEPNFKPDWNYRYLLGCNYVCHLLFVHRNALAKAGPLDSKYNGAQDHDLVLRLSEVVSADRIHHVPEMLYHWRKTPNSTASGIFRKPYSVNAGILAVSDHLARRGVPAKVEDVRGLTLYNPIWQHTASPKVCIIIPFKDEVQATRKCLETVLRDTDYKQFEVILIDNWSLTAEAATFVAEARRNKRARVLHVEESFNFSRLNNLASSQTNAKFLLFMNNDLFPTKKNWLRLLVNEMLADTGVAAVAGRYLYPNGTVQHAGLVVGPKGLAAHAHRGMPSTDYGFIGRIALAHEVTAVTAACMLVRASVFHEVGGFDEVGFKIAFNDVDLCLRIRAAGHRIVYCAEMIAIHHESLSRGSDDRPENELRFFQEQQFLLDRWGDHPIFRRDPAYNPHLTVDLQTFHDLVPPV
jgi:GT2 family glycosyltransferase